MRKEHSLHLGGASLEDEYNTLMSTMEISVSRHLLDEHFTVVWANDYFYEKLGYTREEYAVLFQNRPSLCFQACPQDFQRIRNAILSTSATDRPRYDPVCRMPRKDGSSIWVRIVGALTKETMNGIPLLYVAYVDVDDLVRTQLEQSVTYDNLPGFVAKFRVGAERTTRNVESVVGEDSVFCVHLWLDLPETDSQTQMCRQNFGKKRVLLALENWTEGAVAARIFRRFGVRTACVDVGEVMERLAAAEEHGDPFHLLVVGLNEGVCRGMAGGMFGALGLVRTARRAYGPERLAIGMAARDWNTLRTRAAAVDPSIDITTMGFLQTPFFPPPSMIFWSPCSRAGRFFSPRRGAAVLTVSGCSW